MVSTSVDLIEIGGSSNCPQPANLPATTFVGAVGSFAGRRPIVCGGTTPYCYSYNFKEHSWVAEAPLDLARQNPGSVMIDEDNWWIAGGYGSGTYYDSSIIYDGKTRAFYPGPRLPDSLGKFCLAAINSTTYFLAGGGHAQGYASRKAYLLDWASETWTEVDSMQTKREHHSCNVVGNKVIVTGGFSTDVGYVGGSEAFNLETMRWGPGPDIPNENGKLAYITAAAVTEPEGQAFRIYGGYDYEGNTDEILEYSGATGEFQVLEERMPLARRDHIIIPLPVSDDYC